ASHSFSALAAERFGPVNLADNGPPERVSAGLVTSDFFTVFGVAPRLGRTFEHEQDEVGAPPVAVLSTGLWQRRFGGDPAIINRVVRMNGEPTTIIGVMPPGFDPSASGEELWL